MTAPPQVDVLIVVHDASLADALLPAVRRYGLGTDFAGDATEAKRLLSRHVYKVLVLDLMLPGGAAFDVLDYIRAEKLPATQVIVLADPDTSVLVKLDPTAIKTVVLNPTDPEQLAAYVHVLTLVRPARLAGSPC